MSLLRYATLVCLGFLLHLPALARPLCADELRLNEFMAGPASDWDGSGTFSSRDDEWVEIANAGTTPASLDGWYLTDADSIPRYAFSGTLDPGAVRIVFGGQSVEWERASGHPVFGLSLGNSGDEILLWHGVGGDSSVVDRYAYGSHEAAADRAVGLSPDGTAWQLYDHLNPYTGTLLPAGNGCDPTPAQANVCGSTPAATSTWGRLKSRYR